MKISNQRALSGLLVFLALLFGTFVRVLPVQQAGFPLNDGGLFYTMTSDLQAANYALPEVTSYNHLNIPYAYPPLPFYLVAFLLSITGLSLLEIIRWLPVVFSVLTIPAFFLLAQALLEDSFKAALATLIFALLPRAYEWVIMGGGVTRSPAGLFLILMVWGAFHLFRSGGWKYYLVTIFSGALIILTHPERALHAAAAAAILWLYFGRSRSGVKRAVIVAICILALTAPWWITALGHYGWQPFMLAFQSGGERWLFWSPLLLLNFTDESIALIALLAVVGFAACLIQKKTFLPVWLVLIFFVDPRSAPHVVGVQTSLLAALGLTEVLFPALARLGKGPSETEGETLFLASRRGQWVFAY
ncbi:MAG TPA: glycosyltransferase family 39 protein, partial [Anaerolineaceae bacterium]